MCIILYCFQVMRLGAVPASLSLLPLQVYASSSEKETPKKEFLKIDEVRPCHSGCFHSVLVMVYEEAHA